MTIISQRDLRTILNESSTDKGLRARIEELANHGNIDEEQRTFVEMIIEVDYQLSKAAGVSPSPIDPKVDTYLAHTEDRLNYMVDGYLASVNASAEYASVSSVEISTGIFSPQIAKFNVHPVGPEKAAELVLSCISTLNSQ